ncbi:UDP-N-acetylmuramoylalanine--D-glutamate ligase [uncultured archaeon]|nr:UDP-N-acetylmuramoylalanine--D-glutamate ligase [uncultured archaeon]
MLRNSRVAVLDLTHGGAVIARKLKNIAASVTGIDVYRTVRPEELEVLEHEGIRTSCAPLKVSDFDVLIAPVHLDPVYPMLTWAASENVPVISHHAAVGEILKSALKGRTVIEITGTRAKTSTSILLAEILSTNKYVISHTSRGLEDWSKRRIIKNGLSITPASILRAVDEVEEAGIKPEVFIFEISLGGTGIADIGVITTIADDYMIANNTKHASEAKRSMIIDAKPGSTLVINYDALRFFGACRRDVNIISFSDTVNAAANVYYENIGSDGGTIAYFIDGRKGRITLCASQDYDLVSYKTAFVCAAGVALGMDIEPDVIERSLREFKGAQGRMRKTTIAGRTFIDNSNSGMNIKSAEKALEYAKSGSGRIVMVLGEEAKEVCEGLDPAGVEQFIEKHLHELQSLVLVGERMKHLVNKDINKIYHAGNLSKGIELARQRTGENDTIVSCVKCFR